MKRSSRLSSWGRRSSSKLALCLACSAAPGLYGCIASEPGDDPSGRRAGTASCELPDGYEVLDTGHITWGDIIVGRMDDFTAACAAGEPYPLDGKPRGQQSASGEYPGYEPLGVGTTVSSLKWPGGVVPFVIDPALPDQGRVLWAMAAWELLTPITFVARTSEADYIKFINGNKCSSLVGRQGGQQEIVISSGKLTSGIVGSSIAKNDWVYTWYTDGMASAGTSTDLDAKGAQYPYTLPSGYTTTTIRGIGIAKTNDRVYAWYSDGKVSSGTSSDLDKYTAPTPFSLPTGKTPDDIVEMDIATNDRVYTWFDDGTFTVGTSTDLDAYQGPTAYTLPPGLSISMIAGLGFAGSNGWLYAWYTDKQASAGTATDFDGNLAPYTYKTPGSCDISSVIHEIGHTVGLKHEQSRCDRDDFVRVYPDNILPGEEDPNFVKVCGPAWTDFGSSYNLTSIMHYNSFAFSKNLSPTILALVPAGQAVSASAVVDMSIAGNDWVYTWWSDGTVTGGASNDLELHLSRYNYTLPPGLTTADIAGIGIAKWTDRTYAWYKDGTVSSGTTADLDAFTAPSSYSLPTGYTPANIVAVDIASTDRVYVWYDDGKVSSGTTTDLDFYSAPSTFSLPAGKSLSQLLGIAIAGSNDWTYSWYTTGQASAGSTADFDSHLALYSFVSRLNLITRGATLNAGDIAAVDAMY